MGVAPPVTPADLIGALRGLDTCALSDALDTLGLPGAIPGLPALSVPARVAGRVVTVRLGPVETQPPSPRPGRHLATAAISAARPGDVIVIAHPGGPAAGWGGLLSRAARLKGLSATLVDGPCRDVDEARELGYPVYARGATPITARGRIAELSWGEPVTFGGVPVASGDLVLADGSGAVFVPAERAAEVITMAAGIAARESAMADELGRGTSVAAVMGHAYEHMAGRGINSDD
jgi:regulator of RNase E activity RraA